MGFDSAMADEELARDFFIGAVFSDELEDAAFRSGKAGKPGLLLF